MSWVLHNPKSFVDAAGADVGEQRNRHPDDLLSCPWNYLESLVVQYCAIPEPASDAAKAMWDGSSVEHGEDGRW